MNLLYLRKVRLDIPNSLSDIPCNFKKENDLVTVVIADIMTGMNKVTFHCHVKSLEDIINLNLLDV